MERTAKKNAVMETSPSPTAPRYSAKPSHRPQEQGTLRGSLAPQQVKATVAQMERTPVTVEGNRHHARSSSRQHPRWITRATAQDGRRLTTVNQTREMPQVPPVRDDKARDPMRKQLPTTKVEAEAIKNGPEVANMESQRLRTRGPKVILTSRIPYTGLTAQMRRRSSTAGWAMVLQA